MKAGWKIGVLASISKVFTDGNWIESKDQATDGIRLVQTGNVGEGFFKDRRDKARWIDEETFAQLKCFEVLPGDCLISRLPDPVGRACLIPDTGDKMITAVDCSIVRPDETKIDPHFLVYFTQSREYLRDVDERCSGTTRRRISRKNLGNIPFPLPPLEEQQRIVAVLDEAFEGLARARAHAEANLQNARELFENFLSGRMASESDDWATYSFGDKNVLKIVDGDRGANYPKKTDFLSEGHCLFLNTKNVRPDGFDFDVTMFVSEERDQLLRKGKLLPRDVLLTTRGTIGNVAIFDDTVPYEHIRINSGMLILRSNEDIIRAEFLFELLRSGVIKEQIEEHVSGAAQPQLPIRSLVKFSLPAPKSTDEQLEIVEQLKRLNNEVSVMIEGYETKIQDLNDLCQSLLQKAFAGELT